MKQTLQSFPLDPLNYPNMGTPKVRVWADSLFQASTGEVHPAGSEKENYEDYTLTGAGNSWAFPVSVLDSTTDSDDPNATYSAAVISSSGKVLYHLFERWSFPASLGTLISWLDLSTHNTDRVPLRDDQAYSKIQMDLRLAALASNFKGTYTKATLPTSGATAGWLAYVSDDSRGLWIYNGSRWRPVGNELNLYDCGAACDGVTNDAAAWTLALSLIAASPNNGITLKVPGVTRIASPVVASLSLRGTHAKIEGTSGRSAVFIDVSSTQDALTFSGAENLTIQDIVFVGHATDIDDCKHAVVINNCEQVTFQSVQFYGIYAGLNGAVVKVNNSVVEMRDCAFKGCSGSQITTSVVRVLLHRGFYAYNVVFKDYGVWDNTFYSKVPLGLVNAWVELNSVQPGAGTQQISDMTNQGGFVIDEMRGDEGALTQVMVNIADGQRKLVSAVIRNARVNVSGLDGDSAFYFDNVTEARVEDSWMGYATASSRRAFFVRETARFIVRNSTMAEGVSVIDLNTSTPYAEFENLRFVRTSPALDTFIDGTWGNIVYADSRNTYIKAIVRDKVSEGQAFKLLAAGATTFKEYVQGSLKVTGLAVPAISSVTPNPAGATPYTYWVVAVDRFGRKVISAPVSIANGPAALSGAAYNRVEWNAVGGAVEYRVLRNSVTTYCHVIAPVDPLANSFQFDDTGAVTDTYFLVEGNETAQVEADGNVVAGTGLRVGGGTLVTKIVKGAVAINPLSIPAGTTVWQTFSLPGVKAGDVLAMNCPQSFLTAGVIPLQWTVHSDDTVAILFRNETGGSIDAPSADWRYTYYRSQ